MSDYKSSSDNHNNNNNASTYNNKNNNNSNNNNNIMLTPSWITNTLKSIYNNNNKFTLYVTGGGVESIKWIFTVPGASSTGYNNN